MARKPLRVGIALALLLTIFLVLLLDRAVWRSVMTHRVYRELHLPLGGRSIGWFTASRLTGRDSGTFSYWNAKTGRLYASGWLGDGVERITTWAADGSIKKQEWLDDSVLRNRWNPPWWWEVKPQAEPTAPWLEEGLAADEWLRRESSWWK